MVVIAALKGVLIRFSPLKDLSAEHDVTGSVQRIVTRALMFGYIELMCLRVSVRLDGGLVSPCSFSCCCHFSCQQCSSLSRHSGDERSPLYICAS